MFSDIVDSTPLNESLGDDRWLPVLRAHNALIEDHVHQHGGRVVKTLGDGYMAVFKLPASGVRCALAIQDAMASRTLNVGPDVSVRIGLHTGRAVSVGEDYLGREVTYAARVASAATGNEVLVSDAVRQRCNGEQILFADARTVNLKGIGGTHRVWSCPIR
jgi:class 3 adenylate cyclase